ncbi:MAG: hypothetical protein ACE5GW_00380 [Planctomycetota bacterium]
MLSSCRPLKANALILCALALLLLLPSDGRTQSPTLALDSITVFSGQSGAPVGLRLSTNSPVNAMAMGIVFEAAKVTLVEISLAGGVLSGVPLEFQSINISQLDGEASVGLVLDSTPPYDPVIAPGSDLEVASLIFDVEDWLLPGSEALVQFVDGVGTPPVDNQVFVEGMPQMPELIDGVILVSNENFILVHSEPAAAGELHHEVRVTGINSAEVQGFSVALAFDAQLLHAVEVSIEGTITELVGAEFVQELADNDSGYLIVGVLLDALPPFEGQVIPAAGVELDYVRFFFDISDEIQEPVHSPLIFTDGLGTPPINNIFVINNQSISPQPVDGFLEIIPITIFLRGDANLDGAVDISDGVVMITFVSGLTPAPPCLSALDSNDDGVIDLADALYTLNFLFLAGPVIPPPFPEPGVDPTEDPIPCDI